MRSNDLDDLFSVDPNEFVAARDRLVRELRNEGDKDRANDVKLLRRPAVPVWAVNQVARSDPALIRAVVDAAGTARQAQIDVMNGADSSALRSALAERRDAIERLSAEATTVIERSGRSSGTYERDLSDTLNAIVSSDALLEQLQAARLVNIPTDSDADVDVFAGFPETTRSSANHAGSSRTRAKSEERPAAKRARKEAEARLRHAADAYREAVAARDRAERAFENAQRAVEQAERDRDAAQAALEERQ